MKNLITYLKTLWSRVSGLESRHVGVILEEAAIEHPLSTHSAPFGTCWKPSGKLHSVVRCAAMLVMLFTIGVGNAWGTEYTYKSFTTSFVKGSTNGISVSTQVKTDGTTKLSTISNSNDCFTTNPTTVSNTYYNSTGVGLRISKSSGAGSIKFTLTDALKDSTIYAIVVYASKVSGNNKATLVVTPTAPTGGYTTITNIANGTLKAYSGSYGGTNSYYKLDTIKVGGKKINTLQFGSASGGYTHLQVVEIITQTEKAAGCSNNVGVTKGTENHGEITTISSASVATCSATASDRRVTITVNPDDCYDAPSTLTWTKSSGTVSASKQSGPTDNGDGTYSYVYQFAQNDNGAGTFGVTCTAKAAGKTVNFDAGPGSCLTSSLTETCDGSGVTLPAVTATGVCKGWTTFAGWATAAVSDSTTTSGVTLYAAGDNFVPASNGQTLYAVYSKSKGGGGASTSTLTNSSIVSSGNSSGYKTYCTSGCNKSPIDGWSGKFAVNYVSSGTHYSVQLGRATTSGAGAYNTHLTSPTYASGATHISLTLSTSASQVTANGRKFYLMDTDELNYTAADQTSSYGVGTYDNSDDNYEVSFDVTGSPTQFHIYADGTAYIKTITVTYGGSTTYYCSDPNCCTPLASINGSFSLSSTGTSVTATVTTAGVSAYGDADNVSGYEFKLYTASAGGDAAASYSTNSKAGTSHEFTGLDPLTDYWVTVRPIGDGSTYCNTTAESSRVQITTLCVAPNHVDVSGRWDRFGGETISLTATAYSSAGTGSPIDDANITEWQWQKLVSTTWTDVSNGTTDGVTTSGATTKNLQISNCKLNNSGKYRCIISTGATCSTASATATDGTEGFDVKVYVLECYTGGTTVYNFTRVGDTQAGTAQITLAAGSHTFKFHADNIYYGNDGTINEDVTNWVCSTSQGNLTIAAGLGGTFTISMEYSTSGSSSVEGEPEISVTYPRKTIYLTPGDWNANGAKFAFYYFRKENETIYGEGFTDFITAGDCGSSAEIPQWNGVKINAVRLNSNTTASDLANSANHYKAAWDKKWNQTGDITITSNNSITITDWGDGDSPYTYGNYAVPTYTISYAKGSTTYTGGNTISGSKDSETKTCGVDFTLPSSAVFSAIGYTQTGWTTSDGGSKTHNLGGDYTTNAAQAFYPAWTANTHSLSWSANGGDALTGDYTSGTIAYGTAITAPNTPTWTGHTFNGWHNGSSIVTPATTMPDNDLSYTAQWSLATYTVTLNTNGGTINAGNVTSYTYGTGATLPTNVTRDGYRFDGWFDNVGLTGSAVTTISTTATGDKTYYAKWTAVYTVTWHVNGSTYNTGVVSGNSQVVSGGKISACPTAPADNTLSSCADKFMGWSEKNAGATAKTTSYYDDLFTDVAGSPTINANKDFYAVFAEDNEETKSLTNSEIQTFHTADATTHNSYAKGPFTLTSSDGNWYGVFISQNDGGVYTANVKEAVVTLESTSEEVRPYIMSPTYSDNINSISILATHGSNTSRTLYVCSAATATPASNNIGSITVTKNNSTPQEIIPSSTATTLYLYAAGGAIMIKSIDVSIGSPSNYRTQCDANMVKVTYDANGGSTTCAGGSHDKRNDYTVCSSAPTRDYYTFAGWLCSADSKTYAASATIDAEAIDADFTLTAQWTPVTYNITYELDGGTNNVGNPATYNVTTATITLQDPTKGHDRFEGWYSTYSAGVYSDPVTEIPLGSHEDITLHAKWTTRHEIVFDADGETTTIYRADDEAMDASVAGQGSVPSDPSAPSTCSTKVFVGWSESEIDDETNTRPGDLMKPAEGKVDEDKHYYAVWALRAGSPAPATYAGTGTFVKITSMSEVETDTYYVLRGIDGSTVKVMKNTISSSKMGTADDPVSENVITNPGVAIVWKLGGKKDAYTLYNQSVSKYVEITANATGGYALNASPTSGATYTLTIEDGHGFFFKSNYSTANSRGISIYNASEFRSYGLANAKTLELYKLPAYTYSAYSTSCCETKVNLTHNSPEHGTVEFGRSSLVTCGSDKNVSLTIIPDVGYQLTGWTVNTSSGYADAKTTSPAVVTNSNNSAAQNITLTFAEDANKDYDVTATFGLMTVTSWAWTVNSAAIPDPLNLYVGQRARMDVAYTPAGVDASKKTYTREKNNTYINWVGDKQAAYSTIEGRASTGENTTPVTFTHGDGPTTTVNVKVLPLPLTHFEDLVHGKAFADVAATIVDNALSATKSTPTSDDWVTPNANDCEENHLHLVGWIREDWPALVAYLNGTGDAPATTAIVGAGSDGEGHAYFFAPNASINVQTFNGVTFYAVWSKVE